MSSEDTWNVLQEVRDERLRQDEKWGEQNHEVGNGSSTLLDLTELWSDKVVFDNVDAISAIKSVVEGAVKQGMLTWSDILFEEVVEALEADTLEQARAESK